MKTYLNREMWDVSFILPPAAAGSRLELKGERGARTAGSGFSNKEQSEMIKHAYMFI